MSLHRIVHPLGLLHFLRPVARFPHFLTSPRVPPFSSASTKWGITSFAIRKATSHSDRQGFRPKQGPNQSIPRGTQSHAPGSQEPKNDATASVSPYQTTEPTPQSDSERTRTGAQRLATRFNWSIAGFDQMGMEQKLSYIQALRNMVITDSQRPDPHWTAKTREASMKDLEDMEEEIERNDRWYKQAFRSIAWGPTILIKCYQGYTLVTSF
ncbi:hypothetical protein MMC28_002906 [Mycoblastus sanguinarius]|nr:hypothetical protein [Mycoblastus sanguinarius]